MKFTKKLLGPLILTIVVAAVLVLLALMRKSTAVYIKATVDRLDMTLAAESAQAERVLIRELPARAIMLTSFSRLELRGWNFRDLTTNQLLRIKNALIIESGGEYPSVYLEGEGLRLNEVVVPPKAEIGISGLGELKVNGDPTRAEIHLGEALEVALENCQVFDGITPLPILGEENKRIRITRDDAAQTLNVYSAAGLLTLYLAFPPQNKTIQLVESELPIAELNFMQQRFGSPNPDLTTTIKAATVTFPFLPNEPPRVLPEGCYLAVKDLRGFILKQAVADPSKGELTVSLYGQTSDLRVAYGKGKLEQLLPSSLIWLRQNTVLIIAFGILAWVFKISIEVWKFIKDLQKENAK